MRIAPPIAIGALSPADQAGVKALVAAATEHDGVAPLSDAALARLTLDEPWLTHAVAHNKSGAVIGYLEVDRSGPDAVAQLVVHPDNRGRGVGRMLSRLAAQDATIPQVSGPAGASGMKLRFAAPEAGGPGAATAKGGADKQSESLN